MRVLLKTWPLMFIVMLIALLSMPKQSTHIPRTLMDGIVANEGDNDGSDGSSSGDSEFA